VEPIVVILQTYKRTDYALRTIAAARELLHYDGDLFWHVADDGSPVAHLDAVLAALDDEPLVGFHTARRGYGGNANYAWDRADYTSPLAFFLEDDFVLSQPLDLTPHAYTLMDDDRVGMVRLGYIDGARLEPAQLFAGRAYHTLPRTWPDTSFYALTGHPSLRHARYRAAYGDYPVGLGPGDTELAYASQYRAADEGPLIVWPEGYPPEGYWHHIGEIKTETML
jgi:hypothetical protein